TTVRQRTADAEACDAGGPHADGQAGRFVFSLEGETHESVSVEVFMTKLNKALMASTAVALAAGLSVPASAQDVKPADAPGVVKSSERMKLTVYGQITRAFGLISDGDSNTFKQGENANTSTRMG